MVFLRIVRVHSVRHVSAKQEAAVNGLVVILPIELAIARIKSIEDPLGGLDDHVAVSTLCRLRANLLMVKQHDHLDFGIITLLKRNLGSLNHSVQAAK